MNVENMLRLADHLDTLPDAAPRDREGFTMRWYYHVREPVDYTEENSPSCRTPACIAGWACWMDAGGGVGLGVRYPLTLRTSAIRFLGLQDDARPGGMAGRLFVPDMKEANFQARPGTPGHISSRKAAAVLRHLAETGNLDWSIEPLDAEAVPTIEKLIQEKREVARV